MKFGRIVLQVRIDWQSRISDISSYFQYGGNDVRPPLSAAYAATYAVRPLVGNRQLPANSPSACGIIGSL